MWRPEGWDNTHSGDIYCHDAYESGADAMLEALKAKGLTSGRYELGAGEMTCLTRGALVFIPDEAE